MTKLAYIVAFQVGCLDPLTSDVVETSSEILPPGTVVPALDAPTLAELDGVDELVILERAFSEGGSVRVWDFGPAPSFAAPLFALVERDAQGELTRIDHNTIVAVVPGDPGYSPFWAVLMLEITDRYAGEILPSFAAVDQAISLGLVKPPVLQALAVNCPVVASDVTTGASGMAGHYDPSATLGFAIVGADAQLKVGGIFVRAEYLARWTQVALGDDPATRFKYGPTSGGYASYFFKDGFDAEVEVPVGRVQLLGRFDGLRRSGNVLANSSLRSRSAVLRYTLAASIRLVSSLRLKTSLERYDFSDFDDEVAAHLGLAGPF